jgi:Metallo-peptidase family M12B Reprolysin-like
MGLFCSAVSGQQNFFTDAGENNSFQTLGKREIFPQKYRASSMDVVAMRMFLWSLPSEQNVSNRKQAPVLSLPMPDGKMAKFNVWESSIMEPGLAAKFPEMRTFAGQGIDDPYATIRFDYNPYTGFHAQILSAITGRIYIDPFAKGDVNHYLSYSTKDYTRDVKFICEFVDSDIQQNRPDQVAAPCLGTTLRTYRLALACTGEYSVAVASPNPPSVALSAAAMLVSVNRVTGVYEQEVSLRMTLISNNNLLIYLDGNTDPYTNNNGGAMLGENQANIDAVIGNANYDIGHVFSTGGGGVANLNSPCNPGLKARGVTGSSFPIGDAFDIDYVAHEMGHQWGGNHSMSGCGSSPTSTKYEVGSGTTIQGYAGICGAQNIQPNSDPFFHAISFDEISNYINTGGGSTCGVFTPTGNTLPVINALPNNGLSIPPSTPFILTGTATDANNDPLTYCWEQWDFNPGGGVSWNAGATGPPGNTYPLFKSRIPKITGERTFPDIAVILAGYPANPAATMGGLKGETLSPVNRPMNFRLTVRDNRAGGGGVSSSGGGGCQSSTPFTINVVAGTPFTVSSPNGGESFPGGSSQTVTWVVGNTNVPPINVSNVKISFSTDGGLTYPTVLLASTPNDGSESVTIPSGATTTARVKVEAVGNIFFDISNANFTVIAASPNFTLNAPAPAPVTCPAPASMQTTLTATFNGGYLNPVTLSASGNPGGTTVVFGTNPLTPANPTTTVTLTGTNTLSNGAYTITVTGTGSGAPTQTQNITYTISPGAGPVINTQPASQSVCQGGTVTFTVAATGALSYQWQKSTDGGANWNNIGGATATSNAAILTVNTAPAISAHPQDITLCVGSNHTFSVTATGTALTYQWQSATNCSGPWNNIGGATSSTLNVTASTTTSYRVIVSGGCTPAATSNCATLTVVTSVTITGQPSNSSVCEGGSTSFSASGSGTGLIYQWQLSTDGGSNYSNISNGGVYSGATSGTLTITGALFAMNNYRYRCLISNATCTTPGTSNAAILTVNTLPNVSASPSNATICVGGSNTFSVSATGTGIGYQWQLSADGGANYNDIGGANASTYTVSGATIGMNNNRYRCIVSGTCAPAATSGFGILTVIAPVSIVAAGQPVNSVICSGSNTSFAVSGTSVQTIIYQWQVSADGGANWNPVTNGGVYSGATTATLTITAATTTIDTYRYRCLLSNATCTVPTISGSGILTVRQLPTVTLTSTLTSLLPGQISTLTATPSASAGGVLTMAWLYNGVPPVPPILTNTYVANVEKVGTYHVLIQETFSAPSLVCSNQSAVVTITATASDKLFIFPSPNDGRFTVSYYNNGGASTKRSIVIFDSKGSMVFNSQFNINGPYTLIPIDLRTNNTGIYHVIVGDANGKKLATGKVHVR